MNVVFLFCTFKIGGKVTTKNLNVQIFLLFFTSILYNRTKTNQIKKTPASGPKPKTGVVI